MHSHSLVHRQHAGVLDRLLDLQRWAQLLGQHALHRRLECRNVVLAAPAPACARAHGARRQRAAGVKERGRREVGAGTGDWGSWRACGGPYAHPGCLEPLKGNQQPKRQPTCTHQLPAHTRKGEPPYQHSKESKLPGPPVTMPNTVPGSTQRPAMALRLSSSSQARMTAEAPAVEK